MLLFVFHNHLFLSASQGLIPADMGREAGYTMDELAVHLRETNPSLYALSSVNPFSVQGSD